MLFISPHRPASATLTTRTAYVDSIWSAFSTSSKAAATRLSSIWSMPRHVRSMAPTRVPFTVHDNVDHPLSLYAATKKANELMAHAYAHLFGFR